VPEFDSKFDFDKLGKYKYNRNHPTLCHNNYGLLQKLPKFARYIDRLTNILLTMKRVIKVLIRYTIICVNFIVDDIIIMIFGINKLMN
ncbi:hypothetical protein HZS_3128, partial [Henneguya salminicola]